MSTLYDILVVLLTPQVLIPAVVLVVAYLVACECYRKREDHR